MYGISRFRSKVLQHGEFATGQESASAESRAEHTETQVL